MSTRLPALLLTLAALLSACSFSSSNQTTVFGMRISEVAGEFSVDGEPVPFARTESVSLDLAGVSALDVATSTGEIVLTGTEGTTAELEVEILSQVEGDGRVVVDGGRLMAVSDADGKVFINVVRGTLPRGVVASVRSGTGDVSLSDLVRSGGLDVESGTGAIVLRGGASDPLDVQAGVGEVAIEGWTTGSLGIETGTSAIRLSGVEATSASITSGTGRVRAADCQVGDARIETGTGDVTWQDSTCTGTLDCTSGTGDLTLSGGAVGRLETELGLGSVSRSGTEIGSEGS